MLARYDLCFEHPTFDFFGWGVMAKARGATVIAINEEIPDDRLERINSIIIPGADLLGLPIIRDTGGDRCLDAGFDRWKLRHLVTFTRAGNKFERLKAKSVGSVKYTVTLRHSIKSPYRDSNRQLWLNFAKQIGAWVIEDWYDVPISLHDRMALYAGARMNFGVWSGPMFLLTLTSYPCIITNWGVDEPVKIMKSGITVGRSPPWLASNQRTLWAHATPNNLREAFMDWKMGRVKRRA